MATKREELANPNSCWNTSGDDDVVFVLKGKDIATPATIVKWTEVRVELGKNSWRDPQIIEAQDVASGLSVRHQAEAKLLENQPMRYPGEGPDGIHVPKTYEPAQSRRSMGEGAARPSGWEVCRWPEYQAFAKRLGIDLELPYRDISIQLPMEECVSVTQNYLADDMTHQPKGAVETTTVHNESLKTYKPSPIKPEGENPDES